MLESTCLFSDSMKEEWLPFETKNAALKGKFQCGYIDKKKTKLRKCINGFGFGFFKNVGFGFGYFKNVGFGFGLLQFG